jgi:hypothetical protein
MNGYPPGLAKCFESGRCVLAVVLLWILIVIAVLNMN